MNYVGMIIVAKVTQVREIRKETHEAQVLLQFNLHLILIMFFLYNILLPLTEYAFPR